MTDGCRILVVATRLCRAENGLSDENSELEPPDPISNSEVKRLSADGSVGFPHARVGHCQVSKSKPSHLGRFFYDFLNMLVK